MERALEQQNLDRLLLDECAMQVELEEVWQYANKDTPYVPHYKQAIDILQKRLHKVRKILCNL